MDAISTFSCDAPREMVDQAEAAGQTNEAHGRSARAAKRAARRADKAVRHRRLGGRLEYLLDRFLGTSPFWQLVVLSLLAFAVAGAFGVAASLVVRGDADLDTAPKGFWWALNRMLDGGNVNSDSGLVRRALGVSVTMAGIVLVAALTSAFVSITSEGLTKLHGGKATVFERGHLLVLGWNSRAGVVVRELALAGGATTIVVLAEQAREAIEAEIRERLEELAHAGRYHGKLRCIVRTGDPTTVDAVRIANPRHARVALILPEAAFEAAEPADQFAMRALLALRRETLGRALPTIVEVPDEEGEELVRLAAEHAKHVSIVRSRDVVARLLVETVRQRGVADVIREILSLGGPSLFVHAPPRGRATFGELHARTIDAVLVGVIEDERPVFLPPADLAIRPEHRLVVLSARAERPSFEGAPLAADAPAEVASPRPARLGRILVVGYKPELPEILRLLDGHVAEGARVTLLVPDEDRARAAEAIAPLRLARLAVELLEGSSRRRDVLCAALEGAPFDVAVFLAEDVTSDAVGDADARQLVQLLVARRTRERAGVETRLVVEVRSPNTVRLIQHGKRAGDFVVSREVVGMLLAQEVVAAFRDRRGAEWATALYRDVFDAQGAEVEVRAIDRYARAGEALTFADLAARARGRGELALGYFDGDRLVLAPPRAAAVPTTARGRAVVMARGPGA
jgi:F0F1-type ATP synthase assembly protein I